MPSPRAPIAAISISNSWSGVTAHRTGRYQKFDVAFGSFQWALRDTHHLPAHFVLQPRVNAGADFVMQNGVADDAALADAPLADLELR